MSEPIEYVGGQPEAKTPRVWPYAAASAVLLLILAGALVVFWAPLRTLGRSLGNEVAPYALDVEGKWSENEKVVGGPVAMSLTVRNADNRTIEGITLRMRGLTPGWNLLDAKPDAEVNGESIFFSDTLRAGQSEGLEIRLLPLRAGPSTIQLTLSASHSSRPMRLNKDSQQGASNGLTATVTVRQATPADMAVRPLLVYASPVSVGSETRVDLRVENAGAVRITSVTLQFPELPGSFEVTSTDPQATVSGDGHTVRFPTKVDPGEDVSVSIRIVPHRQGKYHLTAALFLNDEAQPVRLPNGRTQFDWDETVS